MTLRDIVKPFFERLLDWAKRNRDYWRNLQEQYQNKLKEEKDIAEFRKKMNKDKPSAYTTIVQKYSGYWWVSLCASGASILQNFIAVYYVSTSVFAYEFVGANQSASADLAIRMFEWENAVYVNPSDATLPTLFKISEFVSNLWVAFAVIGLVLLYVHYNKEVS